MKVCQNKIFSPQNAIRERKKAIAAIHFKDLYNKLDALGTTREIYLYSLVKSRDQRIGYRAFLSY